MNNNLINSIFVHLGQIFEYLSNSKTDRRIKMGNRRNQRVDYR
jgi:hypothetical protein